MKITTPGAEARLIASLRSSAASTPRPVRLVAPDVAVPPALAAQATFDQRTVGASSPLFVGRLRTTPVAAFDALTERLAAGDGGAGRVADLEALLLAQGFRRTRRGVLKNGDTTAKLTPSQLGSLGAVHVELSGRTRRGRVTAEGVALGGAMFAPDHYAALEDKFVEVLEAFTAGTAGLPARALPTDLIGVKATVRRGESPKRMLRRAEKDAEMAAMQARLTEVIRQRQRAGEAPRGVVLYIAGADAVGKTSTGKLVMDAFVAAGYAPRHIHFRAPDPEERSAPLERFTRGFPGDGEIVFWDRGPAGDAVYGPLEPAVVGAKVADLSRDLADEGVLMLSVELFADPEKQARTLGKRLARRAIADRLAEQLDREGLLTPERLAGIEEIRETLDVGDFVAAANYDVVQERFEEVIAHTPGAPWIQVDATKRHAARLGLASEVEGRVRNAALRTRASA
ncbi:MAG: hypothetical protein RMA76_30115 [Deltaproteobacteria bacterium]